jgi:hypothetical protein
MLDHFPTEQILAWIAEGQVLQQNCGFFRHRTLSLESLLVAGLCSSEYRRGLEAFDILDAQIQKKLTSWVDGLLDIRWGSMDFYPSLDRLAHTVSIQDDPDHELVNALYLSQEGIKIGQFSPENEDYPAKHMLQICCGLWIEAGNSGAGVSFSCATHPLIRRYDTKPLLLSILALGYLHERKSTRQPDSQRQRKWKLRGASAVIEVGILDSVRVLYVEPDVEAAIVQHGLQKALPGVQGAKQGLYAYYPPTLMPTDPRCDDTPGHLVLLSRDRWVIDLDQDEFIDSPDELVEGKWVKWQATLSSEMPSELEPVDLVDVLLTSGDVVRACNPYALKWTLYGQGTVEAYRISIRTGHFFDFYTLMTYENCLDRLMASYPFIEVEQTCTRYEGWMLHIKNAQDHSTVVCSTSIYLNHVLSTAIQPMLSRLEAI